MSPHIDMGDLDNPVIQVGDKVRVIREVVWVMRPFPDYEEFRVPVGTLGVVVNLPPGIGYKFQGYKNPKQVLGYFPCELTKAGRSHYDDSIQLVARSLEYVG